MLKQEKIIEELENIESFANMLLEKCYSVKQLLTLGGFHPRASLKKKAQSKINQVIANRNKAIVKKAKKAFLYLLMLTNTAFAQTFSLPEVDSLYETVDDYFEELTDAETKEYKQTTKGRWLNFLPSPGYSPFTGGFSFGLNLSAPIQEAKQRKLSILKIQSIKKINLLQASALKTEIFMAYETIKIAISDYHNKDSSVHLKEKAFQLYSSQYARNEITPSDFLGKQYEIQNIHTQRLFEANEIYKSILLLLIKSKKPVHMNAPAFKN